MQPFPLLLLAVVLADPRTLPRRVWQGALLAVLILLAIRQGMIYYRKRRNQEPAAPDTEAIAHRNELPKESGDPP